MSTISDWIQTCDAYYPYSYQQHQQPQEACSDAHNSTSPHCQSHYTPQSRHQQQQDASNDSLLELMKMEYSFNTASYEQPFDIALCPQLSTEGYSPLFFPMAQAFSSSGNPVSAQTQTNELSLDSVGGTNDEQQQQIWTSFYYPTVTSLTSYTSSSDDPSPSLSPPPSSDYTSSLSSPGISSYAITSTPFLRSDSPSYLPLICESDYVISPKCSRRNFVPKTSSILTRRQSKVLASNASSVHEYPRASPSLASVCSSTLSTRKLSPLTCLVCNKKYANNSTLRRHLKIHAYADSAARTFASQYQSNAISDETKIQGAAADGFQQALTLSDSVLQRLACSNMLTMSKDNDDISSMYSDSSLSTPLIQGYNPCSDPDIRKPECVGCNKSFARRDTVILHIKNQKRKWDVLSTILPTLTTTASTCSLEAYSSLRNATYPYDRSGGSHRKGQGQRPRRSHPYRMVEKLWQSTMQRKGLQLSSRPRRGGTIGATDSRIEEDLERHRNTGEEGLEQGTPSDNEDKQEEPEDGWPTLDDMSSMDSQTKLRWMMKMMVLPPCWKERKVRLFGAFGVLEENVLR